MTSEPEPTTITEDASLFWVTNREGVVKTLHIVPAGNRTLSWPLTGEAQALLEGFDWHTFGQIKELPPTIKFGAQLGSYGKHVFVDSAILEWEVRAGGRISYLSIMPSLDTFPEPLRPATYDDVYVMASRRGWNFPPLFSLPNRISWVTT